MGYTGDFLEASVNASERSNLISPHSKGYDPDYVQLVPGLKFETVSKNLIENDYLPIVDTNFSVELAQFRQQDLNQNLYSRNADRMIAAGQLNLYYHSLLPFGNLSSEHLYRVSKYNLRFDEGRSDFEKAELFHFFNFELPLIKKFGEAKIEEINRDSRSEVASNKNYINNNSISLVETKKFENNIEFVTENALIHKLSLNLNFYHLGNATYSGDQEVFNQFSNEDFTPNTNGLFDYKDSFFTFENNIQANSMLSALQRTNTLELLLLNNFFSQSPKLLDDNSVLNNLNYLGTLRFSQGILIKNRFVPENQLSRLLVGAKTNIFGVNFDLTDSYFHDSNEHILSLVYDKSFSFISLNGQLIYDSRTIPYNKILNSKVGFILNPEIKISYNFSYDISVNKLNYEDYVIRYLPSNDCWFLEFNYFTDRLQTRYSINFMLNLNEKQFKNYARL